MSYCPKCGNKVDETMTFCPRCGAALKVESSARPAPPPTYRRDEKSEKGEKHEKNQGEKGEKHEKGGFGHIGWLIGGIIVIVIGILAFARATGYLSQPIEGAVTLLIIGIAIIIVAIYLSTMARRRSPAPPV
jgi:zinc-ribbon domain